MLDKDFITRKVSLIQDDLVNLSGLAEFTLDQVVSDFMKQATLERLLERIINRSIDINRHIISELKNEKISSPKDYRETFLILGQLGVFSETFAKEISKSIGTRNILTHEYDKTDQTLVYDSIGNCLRDYNEYCKSVLEFLEKN